MKLLFDQNISFRIVNKLKGIYSDCKHVSDCNLANKEDSEIWTYARFHEFTIVTFDADFYEISMINGFPPKVIWIRTGNLKTDQILSLLIKHQNAIVDFIELKELKDIACLELGD